MTTAEAIRTQVIEWLDDNFHFGEAESLIGDDEASFIDRGILDSVGFVQLVVHLENRYGITIDRQALSRQNFDSLGKIVRFVVAHPDFRMKP